jgi:hypothetical protein
VMIGTNLSKDEVLALEDVGFQLQQKKALSTQCKFQQSIQENGC